MLSTKGTRKGQATIRVELRNELDLQEGERMTVEHVGGKINMERERDIVRQTAGALSEYAKTPPPSPEEMRQAFEEGVAAEVAASMEAERE